MELHARQQFIFPFGQVQEGFVGADASVFIDNRDLWHIISGQTGNPPSGRTLDQVMGNMNERLAYYLEGLSNPINVLFQYKKPEYMNTRNSKEWSNWGEAYFRYNIYQKQQETLLSISDRVGDDIIVTYASPAAEDISKLVTLFMSNQILQNSNFVKAEQIRQHQRVSYTSGGHEVCLHSKPEMIKKTDLLKDISLMQKQIYSKQGMKPIKLFTYITDEIHSAMIDIPKKNDYGKTYLSLVHNIEACEKLTKCTTPLSCRILRMMCLSLSTGLQWSIYQ
jgi:hypothetical protein